MKTRDVKPDGIEAGTINKMLNVMIENLSDTFNLHPINVLLMAVDVATQMTAQLSPEGATAYLRARADGMEADDPDALRACHERAVAAGGRIVEDVVQDQQAKLRRLS